MLGRSVSMRRNECVANVWTAEFGPFRTRRQSRSRITRIPCHRWRFRENRPYHWATSGSRRLAFGQHYDIASSADPIVVPVA